VTQYIVRRLLQTVLVLMGVSALSFGTMFLSGDPAILMAGEGWTRQQLDEFRHTMGFDRPWYVQYFDFLSKAVRGDFGTSLRQKQPTFKLIMDRMPATLRLTAVAMAIALGIGLPLGVAAALKRGTMLDGMLMLVGLAGQAMPHFWLGLLLILVFGVWLRWLPVAGAATPQHVVLPAVTLGTFSAAYIARLARSSMLEVLGQDYVRTALAKGLQQRRVVLGHALRNALLPLVTVLGLQVGALLGGAIITESVFAWPGVGRLTIDAVNGKDLPLVQGCVTVLATIFVLVNLSVDLLYTYLDPRIRLT
jgi:peptide/nickel transport system permease protein